MIRVTLVMKCTFTDIVHFEHKEHKYRIYSSLYPQISKLPSKYTYTYFYDWSGYFLNLTQKIT